MTLRTIGYWVSISGFLGATACEPKIEPGGEPNQGTFESDVPESGGGGIVRTSTGSIDVAPATSVPTRSTASNEAAIRTIEEADIIKLEGSRLYALSQFGGLSIIDVSTRDGMRLLGRTKLQAQPFELYVRDQVVFALYNGYGEYVAGETENERRWVTTSHIVVFDTSDPSSPTVVGRFAVPGTIQDSRIVGDVLYVVGFESNNCWHCAEGQHTTILSLDVSQPNAIRKVDERAYVEDTTQLYSWKRSISVNDQRMYIAGPQYGSAGPEGSIIQVVDISDPSGKLVDGASVNAAGKIDSRWQMDETEGILRVISQPGDWRPVESPRIQTFSVESSQAVTKLANVEMAVPLNEMLRSVRFDGARAYAITAVQTDPLFTIDLADPTQPRQAGELVMPGWIYHMEPKGERLVALGYDQGNAAGALAVSLFDVSDLAKPTMLDRVNFGGDWGSMAEDQDRVHKAFQVLDAANLVLMPFSGYTYDEDNCRSKFQSGVQLIDWANDKLVLAGVAGTLGEARRGFLHDDRLFTVSEERVETFDISDHSAPKLTDSLKLTQNVLRTLDAGTAVVKLGQDWYTSNVSIDTTTVADVENPTSNGHVDVSLGQLSCNSWSDLAQVVADNGRLYLIVNDYDYNQITGQDRITTRLITVDVRDPARPTVLGDGTIDFGEGWNFWYNDNLVNAGASATAVGGAIVALGREEITKTLANGVSNWVGVKATLHVIDPSDPNAPKDNVIELPISFGTTGLLPSRAMVGLGHYIESPTNPARVRFYLDRLDVTNPNRPMLLPALNVPGSPVAFDAKGSRAVTVDYLKQALEGLTAEQCYTNFPTAQFEYPEDATDESALGICHVIQETANLVSLARDHVWVIGSEQLKPGQRANQVGVGDDRVFMSIGSSYYRRYYPTRTSTIAGTSTVQTGTVPLVIVAGLSSGSFGFGQMDLVTGEASYVNPLMAASGKRLLLSTGWRGRLTVVDASDLAAPAVVREAEVFGTPQQLTAIGGVGIASLGADGVQTIPIDD